MKIYQAREKLIFCTNLLNKIKRTKNLEDLHRLNRILDEFDEIVLTNLKIKVKKRKKLREKLKLKHRKTREENKRKQILEKEKAEMIFKQRQLGIERIKTEEKVKRQADVVLQEVNKKKTEGKKILSMLEALEKLREAKVKRELSRSSEKVTESFKEALNHLRKFWLRQLDVYSKEEVCLKAMLEEDSAQRLGQFERGLAENLNKWEEVIFGASGCPSVTTFDELARVRSQWDRFLVQDDRPLASCLPVGWVLPSELQDSWAPFVYYENNPV